MQRYLLLALFAIGLAIYAGCDGEAADDGESSRSDSANQRTSDDDGPDAAIDIVGEYTYRSQLAGGGVESGTVQIARLGDAYDITMIPSRSPQYSGIAILTGNHLAVCYSLPAAVGERGVGSFVINDDGTLSGHWAIFGSDGDLLADTWTPAE